MERTAACLEKLERLNKALRHEEPDRVPISDFLRGSFLERWRREKRLPDDTDISAYYDLDWVVTTPDMEPHIKPFETLRRPTKRWWCGADRLRGGRPQEVRRSHAGYEFVVSWSETTASIHCSSVNTTFLT